MAVLNYNEPWLSSVDGWVDNSDAGCSFALFAADGNPADCVKLSTNTTAIARGASGPTTDTWETLGIPSGATITSVVLTGVDGKFLGGSAPQGGLTVDIWDASGVSVLASTGWLFGFGFFNGTTWTTKTGASQNVIAGKQASTTAVRLVLVLTHTSGIATALGADNLKLAVTYTIGGVTGNFFLLFP